MSPARVQRINRIRGRVVASSLALFVGLFGFMGVRLASGHDPGLAKSKSTAKHSSATTSSAAQLTTQQQPSQAVAPVTTSQS